LVRGAADLRDAVLDLVEGEEQLVGVLVASTAEFAAVVGQHRPHRHGPSPERDGGDCCRPAVSTLRSAGVRFLDILTRFQPPRLTASLTTLLLSTLAPWPGAAWPLR